MSIMTTKKSLPLAVLLPLTLVAAIILLIGSLVVYRLINPPAPPTVTSSGVITVQGQTLTPSQLGQGKQLYELHCAFCHGVNLEGQLNWQNNPQLARPLDPTSPSRQYPDAQLLQIIAEGKPDTPMQGYADSLTEADMAAIIGYLKTHWQ